MDRTFFPYATLLRANEMTYGEPACSSTFARPHNQ